MIPIWLIFFRWVGSTTNQLLNWSLFDLLFFSALICLHRGGTYQIGPSLGPGPLEDSIMTTGRISDGAGGMEPNIPNVFWMFWNAWKTAINLRGLHVIRCLFCVVCHFGSMKWDAKSGEKKPVWQWCNANETVNLYNLPRLVAGRCYFNRYNLATVVWSVWIHPLQLLVFPQATFLWRTS